jgi:endonuclease/exonuclease/phosphatase (EEP) superfamily protein YafD
MGDGAAPLGRDVVVLIGMATLLGLLDRYVWVFELADVFRVQYVVLLLLAVIAAIFLRRPRLAVLATAFAVINVGVIGMPFARAAPAASSGERASLRLVIANVEVGNTDFAAVERMVAASKPDLFGVIELTPQMAEHLRRGLPRYTVRVLHASNDAYGIGVFSRVPLRGARVVRLPRDGPPAILVHLRVDGEPVTVVVTHVRTPFAGSIHVRQLQALASARSTWGKRVAVCGDFNAPPWSGPLRNFASDAGLHELYGHGGWAAYTWPTWGWAMRLPLDNCFLSDGLAVTDHRDGPDVGSDHFPLVVGLALSPTGK